MAYNACSRCLVLDEFIPLSLERECRRFKGLANALYCQLKDLHDLFNAVREQYGTVLVRPEFRAFPVYPNTDSCKFIYSLKQTQLPKEVGPVLMHLRSVPSRIH